MKKTFLHNLFLQRFNFSLRNPHLWIIFLLVFFLIFIYSFWPWREWQFQGVWRWFSWLTFLQGVAIFEGLNRVIGCLFLIPSVYATLAFRFWGSLVVTLIGLITTFPLMLNYWNKFDSWIANVSILLLPVLLVLAINIEFQLRNRDKKHLIELEKVRRLQLSKVIEAQEKERQHIAREIHDDSIQTLLAAASHVEKLKFMDDVSAMKTKADFIEKTLRSTVKELRRLIVDLRPAVLDDLGLVSAIRWLGEQSALNKEINLKIITTGEEVKLSAAIELIVFRVVQEALNNIRTHANATNALVTFNYSSDLLKVSIQDNGQGFSAPRQLSKLGSQGKLGLIGMQERIQSLNGQFVINSSRKTGTLLLIDIPINKSEKPNN